MSTKNPPPACDAHFAAMMDRLEQQSPAQIAHSLLDAFRALPKGDQLSLERYFDQYPYWGSLHDERADHVFILNRALALSEHIEDFRWLYSRLADYRSRIVLFILLANWASFHPLNSIQEVTFSQYFDLDIMPPAPGEVYVDVGAYNGDTAAAFIGNYGWDNYKRIYCYEITDEMLPRIRSRLEGRRDLVLRHAGLADHGGTLYLDAKSDASSNALEQSGEKAVPIVTLDEDVREPVTFIKMDIEGGEQAALRGCEGHIRREAPKLAIAVYHNNEDLWKIPRMIHDMRSDYRFYLRYNGAALFQTETTFLAAL